MTDTIDTVAADQEPEAPAIDEQGMAEQLVAQARDKGIDLVGPDGLLSQLTKRVLETALEAEMSEHLGYDSMTRLAAIMATRVTGCAPRRYLLRSRRSRLMCHATSRPRSCRRSCGSGNGA